MVSGTVLGVIGVCLALFLEGQTMTVVRVWAVVQP